ncbi:malonyl CoA-acyl carrier protein transacylase [Ruminiclostridium papyrosolvens DSM 2782]|uniref:[acyl-carrier-protein] S-malonyltransferase n=1 Tax=Ruminiclostridium papyrosolvens DSM 2782 TaxID=588581 RepID=F1T869_9FIRM|nr:ACP S-malonyltransferase [Ruminiclostridium papyrosolvens]EGD49667.1 malonyl CoA-acyl carrier protein transacylase [Ruminiclostridium papyrosolvens DSM 2782]WES33203.1 ACP S-malonyltransferase [Ruminiclostridium papyrosolvens DSM 2782]
MNKLAFLFPGQGAQYIGMGSKLCENFSVAGQVFDEANEALDFDLKKLCLQGSMDELTKTENTQPAILTASVAAFKVYMQEIGIKPDYTAGHSLGELSALCCAGGIQFADAVRLVRQRGRLMQQAVPEGIGSMAAVSGVEKEIIEKECYLVSKEGNIVVVSNYNSLEQIVISGHVKAVNAVGEQLKSMGARVVYLKVSAPFHSPLMQPASDSFREELKKYNFCEMEWPVISNVTAKPYPSKDQIIDYLSVQITNPVKWQSTIEYLQNSSINKAVEMGPKAVLKNLLRSNTSISIFSSETTEDILHLKKKLISEKETETVNNGMMFITRCIATAVSTKNRNWDENMYQKGVVESYRKLVALKEELIKESTQPTEEHIEEALHLLKQILDTKLLPDNEQKDRLNKLFIETGLKSQIGSL